MKLLCIYHGSCADGFGAAWAVHHAYRDAVEFHAATHGDAPPDVTDREVMIVDFSYPRAVLEAMARQARWIVILDHHKSAAEDLAPFIVSDLSFGPAAYTLHSMLHELSERRRPPIVTVFDMDRSGAGMAWDFCHPYLPRPPLIDRIEDRDLWRFRFPDTRAVQACLFSHPYDFATWDRLMATPLAELALEGVAIERKHHKDIAELVAATRRMMSIGGYTVPVANLPYTLASDAGHLMAQGRAFAACYMDGPKGRTFSLRSTLDGVDVAAVAARYGGGGHRHAAGFRATIGWEGDRV